MSEKTGRNDPCPCGSGKKFKQCCMNLQTGKKKIKARVLSDTRIDNFKAAGPDLLERTFGSAIASANAPFVQKKKEIHKEDAEQL